GGSSTQTKDGGLSAVLCRRVAGGHSGRHALFGWDRQVASIPRSGTACQDAKTEGGSKAPSIGGTAMKTNCETWSGEIAALASDAGKLSPEAAAHVQGCADCQERIAALKAVAALHREAAANLPEPKRRLGRQQLEELLANGRQRGQSSEIRWRP